MRALPWLIALGMVAFMGSASAQGLAFGSETWRGHAVAMTPMACNVFSFFGNGDRIAFSAYAEKGSSKVTFLAFVGSVGPWTGKANRPTSVGPVLDALARSPGPVAVRAWVDDDTGNAVQGSVSGKVLSFNVGALDQSGPAKFFHAVRDGSVLHVSVASQDRRYVLRGTFSALSELVGCALKARDGEVTPSDGMPHVAVAAVAPAPVPPPAAPPPPPPSPTPAPVQPVAASVQPPSRPARREVVSFGSGIVVTADGHVLTNQHVVDGCGGFGLRRAGDMERRAALLAVDKANDLAVLKAERPYAEAVTFRMEPPRMAEQVIVYGFPLAGMLSSAGNVTLGNVSALSGLGDDSREVQVSAAVQPGNSGGPLFDGSGLLLGVVRSKLDAIKAASVTGDIAQNVNFAIKGSLAASFLGANSIEPVFERRRAALPADEVTERAQKVTVQVLCYGAEK